MHKEKRTAEIKFICAGKASHTDKKYREYAHRSIQIKRARKSFLFRDAEDSVRKQKHPAKRIRDAGQFNQIFRLGHVADENSRDHQQPYPDFNKVLHHLS